MPTSHIHTGSPYAAPVDAQRGDGERLDNFRPLMRQANVTKFNSYLDGIKGMQTDSVKLVPGLAAALNMTPAQVQQFLATNYPAMSAMLAGLPQMQADFGNLLGVMSANVNIFAQVPAGLKHYQPLVSTMQTNVDNYNQADSMPNFRLFTWFFVVPGLLMFGLAGWGLFFSGQHRLTFHHRQPHLPMAGAAH